MRRAPRRALDLPIMLAARSVTSQPCGTKKSGEPTGHQGREFPIRFIAGPDLFLHIPGLAGRLQCSTRPEDIFEGTQVTQ